MIQSQALAEEDGKDILLAAIKLRSDDAETGCLPTISKAAQERTNPRF
jgi:hypothetical protein